MAARPNDVHQRCGESETGEEEEEGRGGGEEGEREEQEVQHRGEDDGVQHRDGTEAGQ